MFMFFMFMMADFNCIRKFNYNQGLYSLMLFNCRNKYSSQVTRTTFLSFLFFMEQFNFTQFDYKKFASKTKFRAIFFLPSMYFTICFYNLGKSKDMQSQTKLLSEAFEGIFDTWMS